MTTREFVHRGLPYRFTVHTIDLDFKATRGSGPGGQHRNKTYTGARYKHIPTGLWCERTDSRSHEDNSRNALRGLLDRIEGLLRGQIDLHWSRKATASFGKADRDYVLDKTPRVVDHRTGHRESGPDSVLSGDLDGFLGASLRNYLTDQRVG